MKRLGKLLGCTVTCMHVGAPRHTQEGGHHPDVLYADSKAWDRGEETTGKVKSSQSSLGSSITVVNSQPHPCVLRMCSHLPLSRCQKVLQSPMDRAIPIGRAPDHQMVHAPPSSARAPGSSDHSGERSGSFCPPEIRIHNTLLPVFINLWLPSWTALPIHFCHLSKFVEIMENGSLVFALIKKILEI